MEALSRPKCVWGFAMRTRNCGKCGKPVVADAAHCPRCGRKFKSRWPWIAVAAVVGLALAGTGGRALLQSSHAAANVANSNR